MATRGKAALSEAAVTDQTIGFFEAHGWRPIRHQRFVIPGAGQSGESGMPDYQLVYYLESGVALIIWCELKSTTARDDCRCLERREKGKRGVCTLCAQAAWRRKEMLRSKGRAVVIRARGIDEPVQRAEANGDLVCGGFLGDWYDLKYGWLHQGAAADGQMRLVG